MEHDNIMNTDLGKNYIPLAKMWGKSEQMRMNMIIFRGTFIDYKSWV